MISQVSSGRCALMLQLVAVLAKVSSAQQTDAPITSDYSFSQTNSPTEETTSPESNFAILFIVSLAAVIVLAVVTYAVFYFTRKKAKKSVKVPKEASAKGNKVDQLSNDSPTSKSSSNKLRSSTTSSTIKIYSTVKLDPSGVSTPALVSASAIEAWKKNGAISQASKALVSAFPEGKQQSKIGGSQAPESNFAASQAGSNAASSNAGSQSKQA